jgi:hypothetical protein
MAGIMQAYTNVRLNMANDDELWCWDPIMKHFFYTQTTSFNGVRVFAENTKIADQEVVNQLLHELAFILNMNRNYNYSEVAETFPICAQAMVAQYDNHDPRTGVTHFAHTRSNVSMCMFCCEALRDRIRSFEMNYPNIMDQFHIDFKLDFKQPDCY